jgi:exodeoxyribonuclease VII large subunit
VQLARVLPKAESLFAGPRQRLDQASERLGQSLRKNLQVHRVQFSRAEAQLRTRMLKDRMTVCGERVAALGTRAERAQRARLAQARRQLDGLTRVLDSVSHKSVLERGFALVRGEDGKVRRRAASVKPGEALTLTFADGDKPAVAEGGPARAKGKKPIDQGSLF